MLPYLVIRKTEHSGKLKPPHRNVANKKRGKVVVGTPLSYINNLIIWGANHPYSQLRAELRRTRLQRVREAGMQGRIQLPATSTHYDHGAQPRSKVFIFFLWEENRIVWKTLVAQQRTNANSTHILWPRPESNRGHLGERRALYAQANRATILLCTWTAKNQEGKQTRRHWFILSKIL